MKKIVLSDLFTANNYVAPEFSPEKKAQIFANTTRKKRSLLKIKKKYFIEVALSLILVFVIGFNLDYIQNIGKPIELDYQEVMHLDSGVLHQVEHEVERPLSTPPSNSPSNSPRIPDLHKEKKVINIVNTNKDASSKVQEIKTVEDKSNSFEEISTTSKEDNKSEDIKSDDDKSDDDVGGKNENLAYEIVEKRPSDPELWDEKYFVDEEKVGEAIDDDVDVPPEDSTTHKTQLLEMVANEVSWEEKIKPSIKAIDEPVMESNKKEEPIVVRKSSFVNKQSISVSAHSAQLNFSLQLDRDQISNDIALVCNIYLHWNFVDSFAYTHQSDHQIKSWEIYSFVDVLWSSYALYVLNSYTAEQFDSDDSGIKCSIPEYNISAKWIDLAYE